MIAGPSPSRLYFCSFRFVAFLLYWSLSLFSIFIAPTLFDIKNKSKRTRFPFFFSPASDRQEALSVLYSCKGFLFHFFLSFPICVESVSDWKKKLLSFQLTCELTFSLSWIARDIARLWELLRTLRDGGYDRHESLVKQRGSGGGLSFYTWCVSLFTSLYDSCRLRQQFPETCFPDTKHQTEVFTSSPNGHSTYMCMHTV